MSWRTRLEGYVAEAKSREDDRRITVSAEVMKSAEAHKLQILRTSRQYETLARVKSASSGSVYLVELYVDEAKIFPSFPYVWKCSCKWARERFAPCSHVIAVSLFRERKYANEHRSGSHGDGEESPRLDLGLGAESLSNHGS